MASGVKCNDNVKEYFLRLQSKKEFRFLCFKLAENDAEVTLDEHENAKFCSSQSQKDTGETKMLVNKLKTYLVDEAQEPRYCVIDVREGYKQKVVFFLWNLDSHPVRRKMVYASSKEAVVKQCNGIQKQLQVSDPSDLTYDTLMDLIQ